LTVKQHTLRTLSPTRDQRRKKGGEEEREKVDFSGCSSSLLFSSLLFLSLFYVWKLISLQGNQNRTDENREREREREMKEKRSEEN